MIKELLNDYYFSISEFSSQKKLSRVIEEKLELIEGAGLLYNDHIIIRTHDHSFYRFYKEI